MIDKPLYDPVFLVVILSSLLFSIDSRTWISLFHLNLLYEVLLKFKLIILIFIYINTVNVKMHFLTILRQISSCYEIKLKLIYIIIEVHMFNVAYTLFFVGFHLHLHASEKTVTPTHDQLNFFINSKHKFNAHHML